MRPSLVIRVLLIIAVFFLAVTPHRVRGEPELTVSILAYHRFGPVVADGMTVRTGTLRWHLEYLKTHGHQVIPLRDVVAWVRRLGAPPPRGAVVITVDDGHRSVATEMLPLVREFNVPVTVFVYPSAISNASYAMTWDQLRALAATGLFDIESHTYWHPNFSVEKRRLTADAYRTFVAWQLERPRRRLGEQLGADADMLSWPFGIYDDELLHLALDAGYVAGVTLQPRPVTGDAPIMALPRFLVTDSATGARFTALLPSRP